MISSDFRAEARRKLQGKWGKAALISLAYLAIFFIISFVEGLFPESMQSILAIVTAIIEVPLGFGLILSFFKLFNDEEVKAFDFLSSGFSNFKKSWGITFQIFLKMIVPVILIIVSYILIAIGIFGIAASVFTSSSSSFGVLTVIGFILLFVSMIWAMTKSYYYQLAYIVAADNSQMSAKDSVLKSEEIMRGNRWKLFCLSLSFIGWSILACFTFGIAFFWLIPYIQFAILAFYKYLNGDNSKVETEVVTKNNDNPIQGE